MSSHRRLHAVVTGRVQGVGFRFFVVEQAQRLGLTGWVRNVRGRGVEVVAEGAPEALERLLAALGEGPPLARVEQVQADWLEPEGDSRRFEVRPSAY